MNSLPVVTEMHFVAATATTGEIADRLRRICNEVALEIVNVARMTETTPTSVHRERMRAELLRAAALFLHAEPCIERLEAIAAGSARPSYTPAPVEASPARFDGCAPESRVRA